MADREVRVKITGQDDLKGVLGKTGTAIKSFVSQAGSVLAGLGAAFSAAAIGKFFKDSITAAGDAERIWTRLGVAVDNVGIPFESVRGKLEGLAEQMQATSRFSDEDFATSLGTLLGITNDYNKALAAVPVAAGLAVRLQTDLASASTLVGKALAGNTVALQRQGITIDKNRDVLSQLAEATRGYAERDGASLAGQLERLKNGWDNFEEAVGRALTTGETAGGIVGKLTDKLKDLETWITENDAAIQGLLKTLADFGRLAGEVSAVITGPLGAAWNVLVLMANAVRVALFTLGTGMRGAWADVQIVVGTAIETIAEAFQGSGFQALLETFGLRTAEAADRAADAGARLIQAGARLRAESEAQRNAEVTSLERYGRTVEEQLEEEARVQERYTKRLLEAAKKRRESGAGGADAADKLEDIAAEVGALKDLAAAYELNQEQLDRLGVLEQTLADIWADGTRTIQERTKALKLLQDIQGLGLRGREGGAGASIAGPPALEGQATPEQSAALLEAANRPAGEGGGGFISSAEARGGGVTPERLTGFQKGFEDATAAATEFLDVTVSLNESLGEMAGNTLQALGNGFELAFEAIGAGANVFQSLGKALASSLAQAASAQARYEFAAAAAALATAIFPGNPAAFAAAAKHAAAGAAFAALAGALGGGGGHGGFAGGGGGIAPGRFEPNLAASAGERHGTLTVVFRGGYIDPHSVEFQDTIAEALKGATGRRVIIRTERG